VATHLPLRLATRGSPLALWQAHRIAALLGAGGVPTSIVEVETEGDRRTDVPLHAIGGQGVFIKEVQAAVVRGEADVAVHSAKDLPASSADGAPDLVLAAFPERGDPRDVLVGGRLDSLAAGAMIATGSVRRRVQLANLRPDLTFTDLRGNLATRLGRVGDGGVVAVVVAGAALDRLAWRAPEGTETEVLDPVVMVPQVGQGALALECRADDTTALDALSALDDVSVRRCVTAERAYLAELGGSCTLPVGAHALLGGDVLTLTGMLAGDDGRVVLRHEMSGDDPEALGRSMAHYLLEDAGGFALGPWGPADEGGIAGAVP